MEGLHEDTGATGEITSIVEIPFGKYVVKVKLGPKREFIDVVEVRVSKSFLSQEQRTATRGYHDVSDLYPE